MMNNNKNTGLGVAKKELIKKLPKLFEWKTYRILQETKYEWIPILHCIVWDGLENMIYDVLLGPEEPHELGAWFKEKEQQTKKGYLLFGDVRFDFLFSSRRKISGKIILAIYVGAHIMKEFDSPEEYRQILYQVEGLDIEKVKKALSWKARSDKRWNDLQKMEKPFVFFKAAREDDAKTKPFSYVSSLLTS